MLLCILCMRREENLKVEAIFFIKVAAHRRTDHWRAEAAVGRDPDS